MQEPLFDIFGSQHREPTLSNRQITEQFKGNNLQDLKAGTIKKTQKKALVDVKNRLALAPVVDNRAGPLKPSSLSTPAFNKTKSTSFKSTAHKPSIAKKEQLKSDKSSPFMLLEETLKKQMGAIPFEEDDYEDLMPKSERFNNEQIHKLVNFWELTRPPLSSSSPPRGPVALDISTPELEVPDICMATVPIPKLQPISLPSFQIWEDDED